MWVPVENTERGLSSRRDFRLLDPIKSYRRGTGKEVGRSPLSFTSFSNNPAPSPGPLSTALGAVAAASGKRSVLAPTWSKEGPRNVTVGVCWSDAPRSCPCSYL